MSERLIITETVILRFPPGMRLKHDEARERWVVLAPERMFVLDEIGAEILKCIDGQASLGSVINDLAKRFDAPRTAIAVDVIEMLQDFADKGVVGL